MELGLLIGVSSSQTSAVQFLPFIRTRGGFLGADGSQDVRWQDKYLGYYCQPRQQVAHKLVHCRITMNYLSKDPYHVFESCYTILVI